MASVTPQNLPKVVCSLQTTKTSFWPACFKNAAPMFRWDRASQKTRTGTPTLWRTINATSSGEIASLTYHKPTRTGTHSSRKIKVFHRVATICTLLDQSWPELRWAAASSQDLNQLSSSKTLRIKFTEWNYIRCNPRRLRSCILPNVSTPTSQLSTMVTSKHNQTAEMVSWWHKPLSTPPRTG